MPGRLAVTLDRPELAAYRDESILLLGGAGFIGSHLADQLGRLGARIVVLDNLSSGRRENLEDVDCDFVEGDILDCDLAGLMRQHGVDRVFNFACGSLAQSLTDAGADFHANAVSSVTALEQARRYGGLKAFVYCSTGSVYGEPDSPRYTEATLLRPTTPYGTSKACADLYAQMYASFFSLPTRIVRYNNIYGPRKRGTAVPIFVEKALRKETITIEGGAQVRTPTFVLDAVEATLLVGCAAGIDGEYFNVSSERSYSIDELVRLVWSQVNGEDDAPKIVRTRFRPGEIMSLQPSVDKIRQRLGWQAAWTFEMGLGAVIDYERRLLGAV